MTPLAQKIYERAVHYGDMQLIADLMAKTQFFDCRALRPFLDHRMSMPDARMATYELLDAELPAVSTWLDLGGSAIVLTDESSSKNKEEKIGVTLLSEAVREFSVVIMADGLIHGDGFDCGERNESTKNVIVSWVRCAWYCIEAMQTHGMTHQVETGLTRQQARALKRAGKPCHKWVEIRLGSGRFKSGGTGGTATGRTVAWHYRRGHRINHPNPNFPKWRKGGWVGSPEAGIRTHNYVVEVPEYE